MERRNYSQTVSFEFEVACLVAILSHVDIM